MNNRVLVYTCCDKKYSDFIPIFCAALLNTNKDIDIEIGTSAAKLTCKQEKALESLRALHTDSKILIKYNYFAEKEGKALFNNALVEFGTVRFISEPTIKNKYTYISDIDIISLDKNFAQSHINDMKQNQRTYSNIVRKNTNRLSGLHFCLTNQLYPLNLNDVTITECDEQVLFEIMQKKTQLDYNTSYRPVHGIHMSLNRPKIRGTKKNPGWFPKEWDYCSDRDNYKKKWFEFKNSRDFACILESIEESDIIQTCIKKLEHYYRTSFFILFSHIGLWKRNS